MNNRPRQWFRTGAALSLLLIAAALLVLFALSAAPTAQQTGQAEPPPAQEPPAVAMDSPLPTPTPIVIIEPTWTPWPTLPPPPTPTIVPGPTATAMPLLKPASDAAGHIMYLSVSESFDENNMSDALQYVDIYSLSIDGQGKLIHEQPQLIVQNIEIDIPTLSVIHPSPDRTRIAIENGWGQSRILYPATGKVESLFREGPDPTGIFFDWHPDSRQILMRADDNYMDPGLWLVDADSGVHTTILAQFPAPNLTGGALSPDGQRVVYSLKVDFATPSELWLSYVDGSSHEKLDTTNGYFERILWSPDGSKIAYSSGGDLVVIDLSDRTRHDFRSYHPSNYSWSPDSRTIVAGALRTRISKDKRQDMTHQENGIYLIDVAMGQENILPLVDIEIDGTPTWSPDGAKIVFVANQNHALWIVDSDGSNLTQLMNEQRTIWFPRWHK